MFLLAHSWQGWGRWSCCCCDLRLAEKQPPSPANQLPWVGLESLCSCIAAAQQHFSLSCIPCISSSTGQDSTIKWPLVFFFFLVSCEVYAVSGASGCLNLALQNWCTTSNCNSQLLYMGPRQFLGSLCASKSWQRAVYAPRFLPKVTPQPPVCKSRRGRYQTRLQTARQHPL